MSFDLEHQEQYYSFIVGKENHVQMSNVPLAVIKDHLIGVADKYKRKTNILEYGSGVSTLWFGKTFPDAGIVSVEGDQGWYENITKWLRREKIKNVDLRFVEQTPNWRDPEEYVNPLYLNIPEGPFDLIINDGCVREKVAETLMLDMDRYLKVDGLYLRHDYMNLIKGDWVGVGLSGNLERITYEEFCTKHPNYSVITLNGNGRWGVFDEFGGVWRKP
jgi:hypothetical protein